MNDRDVRRREPDTDTKKIATTANEPIIIGVPEKVTSQWGVIGKSNDTTVKIDLNEPHIVTICGGMGTGKGYTIGVLCEMLCSKSIPHISQVEKPATLLVLHRSELDICSEFNCITSPNDVAKEINGLDAYDAKPRKIVFDEKFRVFVTPKADQQTIEKFREEYKTKNILPLYFCFSDLKSKDWSLVLSKGDLTEAPATNIRLDEKVFGIIDRLSGDESNVETLLRAVSSNKDLSTDERAFIERRLGILKNYFIEPDSSEELTRNLAIGGVNIFDFRGPAMLSEREDQSLMTLILSLLKNKKNTFNNEPFVFVINEAHSYFRKGISGDFAKIISDFARLKRHYGIWVLLDSQRPDDIDEKILSLSDIKMNQLRTGEAQIDTNESSQGQITALPVKVRPRLTKHGGPTKTAVE